LAAILATNVLDTRTTDLPSVAKAQRGISLTRSYLFAKSFGRRIDPILVLDAATLVTKPVAYWDYEDRAKYNRDDESEEVSLRPISPLDAHLISINAPMGFDDWVADVSTLRNNTDFIPWMLGDKLDMFKAAIDDGFEKWRPYWNKWSPRVG